jgi:hypothetical protein
MQRPRLNTRNAWGRKHHESMGEAASVCVGSVVAGRATVPIRESGFDSMEGNGDFGFEELLLLLDGWHTLFVS